VEFSVGSGPKFAGPISSNAEAIARDQVFPIFDMLPHSGYIRDQSLKW